MKGFGSLHREHGAKPLNEDAVSPNPFAQFEAWFTEVLTRKIFDPSAMLLATADKNGQPDARIVLLKAFSEDGFVFYSNYDSVKASHIAHSPHVALLFYWAELGRQVRIKGKAMKVSPTQSKNYFASRPRNSQISAIVSAQSAVISSREFLEKRYEEIEKKFQGQEIICPENWGGYCVIPNEIEFFQYHDNRLHDRLRYRLEGTVWKIERLSP